MNMRLIKTDNIYNFRDLGGIKNKEGKKIKPNLIFRSARLENASESDINLLVNLNIKEVFDYRTTQEVIKHPNVIIDSITNYSTPALKNQNASATAANVIAYLKEEGLTKFDDANIEMYKTLPFDNLSYKFLFTRLQTFEDHAFLLHCTAGRDRTGIASALILLLLDVDLDSIIEDYLLSNEGLKDFYSTILADYTTDPKIMNNIVNTIELKPKYIQATFDTILQRYSSFDEYFLKEYNIDATIKNKIKEFYLI